MTPKIKELTNEIDRLLGGEIKELKFGCELFFDSKGTTIKDGRYFVTELKHGCVYCVAREFDSGDFTQRRFAIEDNFEILGRPINLEDVMRAIDIVEKNRQFSFVTNGYLIEHKKGGIRPILEWKLGKPLSLQSPETVEKIAEILNEAKT